MMLYHAAKNLPLIVLVALLAVTIFNGATGKIAGTVLEASDGRAWEGDP